MTLDQMRYFKTLAETGHMGQAAEKLFLAQPSLSVSIARLEKELGVPLFDRRGHRMTLTDAGEAYLRHVERILREVKESTAHMSRLASSQQTKIRLGCITPLLNDYFPSRMRVFLRRPENRNVRFECSIENTEELVKKKKNGVYDLLLCSRSRDEEVAQTPILTEPIRFIAPAGTPPPPEDWEKLIQIPLVGYEENSVMDTYLQEIAEQQGGRLPFVYRAPTENAIVSLVAHGLGGALIPWGSEDLRDDRVVCYPFRNGQYARELYLTTLRDQENHGAAQRLIQFLLQDQEEKTGGPS